MKVYVVCDLEGVVGVVDFKKQCMEDGQYYQHDRLEYDDPEYRFQAVQDGDRFALQGFPQQEARLQSWLNHLCPKHP